MHYGEPDDAYLGSGTLITKAIDKYGKQNFSKFILEFAESEAENAKNEEKWISFYNAVADKRFYNIHVGGFGGNTWSGQPEQEKEYRKRQLSIKYSGAGNPRFGKHCSEETKNKIRQNRDTSYMQSSEYRTKMSIAVSGIKNGMYGKHHSDISKTKMSESKKGKNLKANNGNAKKISAYLDAEHTIKVQDFDCMQDALIFVHTNPKDYSGLQRRMKQNKPYKGFYWVKSVETNIEEQR